MFTAVIPSMEQLNLPNPRPSRPPVDVEHTSDALRQDLATLRRTCEELRADLDWLTADVAKMRGKITGGSRRNAKPEETNGEQPQPDINQAIKDGHFFRRR